MLMLHLYRTLRRYTPPPLPYLDLSAAVNGCGAQVEPNFPEAPSTRELFYIDPRDAHTDGSPARAQHELIDSTRELTVVRGLKA